jgi:Sigma-70 region 2
MGRQRLCRPPTPMINAEFASFHSRLYGLGRVCRRLQVDASVHSRAPCARSRALLSRKRCRTTISDYIFGANEPPADRSRLNDMNATAQRTRDAWLALRCQSGDADAFREMINEMERPLLYFATKMLCDGDAALDVLQQTWLRAIRTIRRLQQPEQLRPWAARVEQFRVGLSAAGCHQRCPQCAQSLLIESLAGLILGYGLSKRLVYAPCICSAVAVLRAQPAPILGAARRSPHVGGRHYGDHERG